MSPRSFCDAILTSSGAPRFVPTADDFRPLECRAVCQAGQMKRVLSDPFAIHGPELPQTALTRIPNDSGFPSDFGSGNAGCRPAICPCET